MIQFSRTQIYLALTALLLMRVAIGFHFFKEGTTKLKDGDFTAEYFLAGAKGPLAPYFHSILDDHDGRDRLCIKEEADDASGVGFDTELTFALWEDFADRANS